MAINFNPSVSFAPIKPTSSAYVYPMAQNVGHVVHPDIFESRKNQPAYKIEFDKQRGSIILSPNKIQGFCHYHINNDGGGDFVTNNFIYNHPPGTFNDLVVRNLRDNYGRPKPSLTPQEVEKFYEDVSKRSAKSIKITGGAVRKENLLDEEEALKIISSLGVKFSEDELNEVLSDNGTLGFKYGACLTLRTKKYRGHGDPTGAYEIRQDGSAQRYLNHGTQEIAPKGTYSQLMQDLHTRYLTRLHEKPLFLQ